MMVLPATMSPSLQCALKGAQRIEECEKRLIQKNDSGALLTELFQDILNNPNYLNNQHKNALHVVMTVSRLLQADFFGPEQATTIKMLVVSHFDDVGDYFCNCIKPPLFPLLQHNMHQMTPINYVQTPSRDITNLVVHFSFATSDESENLSNRSIDAKLLIDESAYFKVCLTSSFKESAKKEFHISDVTVRTFDVIVRFLQNHELETVDDHELLFDLIEVADRWEMLNLLSLLDKQVNTTVTNLKFRDIPNLVNFINVASLRGAIDIAQKAQDQLDALIRKMEAVIIKSPFEVLSFIKIADAAQLDRMKQICAKYLIMHFNQLFLNIPNMPLLRDCLYIVKEYVKEVPTTFFKRLSTRKEIYSFMTALPIHLESVDLSKVQAGSIDALQKKLRTFLQHLPRELKKIRICPCPCFGDEELKLLSRRCPQLEEIEITYSAIRNLSSIAALTSLRVVNFKGSSHLEDIAAIGNLLKLQSVDLSLCNPKDFSPISRLVDLKELRLEACTALTNLEFLEPLQLVKIIDLTSCYNIQDTSILSKMPSVPKVSLPQEEKGSKKKGSLKKKFSEMKI